MIKQNYLLVSLELFPVCVKLSCAASRMYANDEQRKGGYDREIRLTRLDVGNWQKYAKHCQSLL